MILVYFIPVHFPTNLPNSIMPTVLNSLNSALYQALATDKRVILLGEDLLDPYGGAFKVTQGLSTDFPNRVLTTPISEAGIVGVATGMALRGLRPVVEIMFGDFLTLIADQVINHAVKFHWMYNHQVTVPLVIRSPMGGRRGYGPTHSQTLEKYFLGVPGLRVLAPCSLVDPGNILLQAILEGDHPTLFIENKLLYPLTVADSAVWDEFQISASEAQPNKQGFSLSESEDLYESQKSFHAPTYTLSLRGAPSPSITLTTYGYMAELARQAALRLAYEFEIFVELVIPIQLSPFNLGVLFESVNRTRKLLTVEEGTHDLGWGAEVLARAAETSGVNLDVASRLAAVNLPIPASGSLEAEVLPSVDHVVDRCLEISKRSIRL